MATKPEPTGEYAERTARGIKSLVVRFPSKVHKAMMAYCKREDVSANSLIVSLIERRVTVKRRKPSPTK